MARVKALVLGEDTRSFLSVIRSLGRMGFEVHVVCYDGTSPALKSKYVTKHWNINHQAYSESQWLESISDLIKLKKYQIVIPCDERAIFPLSTLKTELFNDVKIAIPNKQVLENLFDKNKTRIIAQKLGVPVAKGVYQTLNNDDFSNLLKEVALPFVIKPTESFTTNNLSRRNKVEIIKNEQEYNTYLKNVCDTDKFLVEQYFTGVGEGLSLFAVKGDVKFAFAHKRVHEPRSGGGSSYRVSISIDPEILKACEKICKETQYDGVGMFEFKRNFESGEWILIEVNARFWGSLPLAIYSGIDFPMHYANYLLREQVPSELSTNYRVNARARNLINDIYDARIEMNYVGNAKGKLSSYWYFMKRMAGFLSLFGHECIDTYALDDPKPFWSELKQLTATLSSKLKSSFSIVHSTKKIEKRLLADLDNALSKGGKAIFVCYGNIMRSPFAEQYFSKITDKSKWQLQTDSFGFHQKESRDSPLVCQACAPSFGVDLSNHQSKWLKQSDIGEHDVVFIFDKANEEKISKYYDAPRCYSLADFAKLNGRPLREISDPWGHSEHEVAKCYKLIANAIEEIFIR